LTFFIYSWYNDFMRHKSIGTLRYGRSSYWLVVDVDPQLVAYYRRLLPQRVEYSLTIGKVRYDPVCLDAEGHWVIINPQRYDAHISVVRNEVPTDLSSWGKYDGQDVEFEYEHEVRHDDKYWWLDVYCERLEAIRGELGLSVTSVLSRPPDGRWCFHCTIGNTK